MQSISKSNLPTDSLESEQEKKTLKQLNQLKQISSHNRALFFDCKGVFCTFTCGLNNFKNSNTEDANTSTECGLQIHIAFITAELFTISSTNNRMPHVPSGRLESKFDQPKVWWVNWVPRIKIIKRDPYQYFPTQVILPDHFGIMESIESLIDLGSIELGISTNQTDLKGNQNKNWSYVNAAVHCRIGSHMNFHIPVNKLDSLVSLVFTFHQLYFQISNIHTYQSNKFVQKKSNFVKLTSLAAEFCEFSITLQLFENDLSSITGLFASALVSAY